MADDATRKPGGTAALALLLSVLALLLIGTASLRAKAMERRLEGVVQQRLAEATVRLEARFDGLERAHRLEQLARIQGALETLKAGLPADQAAQVERIRQSVGTLTGQIQGNPAPPSQ